MYPLVNLWRKVMTVEELIKRLQQVKDKKSQIKMDTPSGGSLLYRGIRNIRIDESKGFTIIEWIRE